MEKVFVDFEADENIALQDQDVILLLPTLLTADLITTRLIQDSYYIDEETNQLLPKDEWTSLTFLSESIKNSNEKSSDNTPRIPLVPKNFAMMLFNNR